MFPPSAISLPRKLITRYPLTMSPGAGEMAKRPFDIRLALALIESAIRSFPKAAMFQLADEGNSSPFEMLAACIISIRTLDEVTVPCTRRLFAIARTPEEMHLLDAAKIESAISGCTFSRAKSIQILEISRSILAGSDSLCQDEVLLSFRGVGPKCANLVLGIACGKPRIGVDIHVHRVTNRWGYIRANSPEKTLAALQSKLPTEYHVTLNRLLVPFGKHICTGRLPRCSTCPVLDMCLQVGVIKHR